LSTETPAVDGALVAPVENAPAEPVKQEAAPEPTTEPQGESLERDEKGRFKSGAQERINEITRARREAERRAEAAEQRAAQHEAELAKYRQPQAPQERPPTLEDFGYDQAAWSQALTQYAVAQATRAVESKYQQQDTQSRQQAMVESFGKREREFAAKHPDYLDVTADLSHVPLRHLTEVFGNSENGPALLYHLAMHLDEADRISRMSPTVAALHLGRLEAQITAPKTKPVSNAPPPAPQVGGASTVSKDPDRMPIDEWMRWRRDQLKAK
jgi:hypothetical protein